MAVAAEGGAGGNTDKTFNDFLKEVRTSCVRCMDTVN